MTGADSRANPLLRILLPTRLYVEVHTMKTLCHAQEQRSKGTGVPGGWVAQISTDTTSHERNVTDCQRFIFKCSVASR